MPVRWRGGKLGDSRVEFLHQFAGLFVGDFEFLDAAAEVKQFRARGGFEGNGLRNEIQDLQRRKRIHLLAETSLGGWFGRRWDD